MFFLRHWMMPVRLKMLYNEFHDRSIVFLDVGCGKHGVIETKKYFPRSEYHGIDRESLDLGQSGYFYQIDLEKDSLPMRNESFDCLIASHLLEHLSDPYTVLRALCKKVKSGGKIYLEFPSIRSMGLSSMEGTLQFCDDATHIHLPDPYRLMNVLLSEGITVRKAGTRRDWFRLMISPLFLLRNLFRQMEGKRPLSKGLWDLKGFAYYIYAEKR